MKTILALGLVLLTSCTKGPSRETLESDCDWLVTTFDAVRIPSDHPKSSFRCEFRMGAGPIVSLTEDKLVGAVAALNILMGEKKARVWEPCFKKCLKKGNFMCKNHKDKKCSMSTVKSYNLLETCETQCNHEADRKVKSIYQ